MECVRLANAKGLYGFSRTFEILTCTLRSSESCTAFLINCTDQDNPRLLQKVNPHLNRLGALKEMPQGQEQDILAMLGNIKLKPGKGPRKPIYIVDEAAPKEGGGKVSSVSFLLKEPVEPIDLHVANKALPNTPATETDKNCPLYHLTQPCIPITLVSNRWRIRDIQV